MSKAAPNENSTTSRWYHEPYMWMVVGGPAFMVAVSMVLIYIAVNYRDPALDREIYERDLKRFEHLEGQARREAILMMQPARQARNHAASPVVPEGQ